MSSKPHFKGRLLELLLVEQIMASTVIFLGHYSIKKLKLFQIWLKESTTDKKLNVVRKYVIGKIYATDILVQKSALFFANP